MMEYILYNFVLNMNLMIREVNYIICRIADGIFKKNQILTLSSR
jgi:hypothetical protein